MSTIESVLQEHRVFPPPADSSAGQRFRNGGVSGAVRRGGTRLRGLLARWRAST